MHPISPETMPNPVFAFKLLSFAFLNTTSASIMRIIAIAKSPAADISCVGISFIPAGARLSSGNTTPNTESVGLP